MPIKLKEIIDKYGYVTPDGKIYLQCQKCKDVVRINKPIFGSIHVCIKK